MSEDRDWWFRFWVDAVGERIQRAQRAVLVWGCPVLPPTATWTRNPQAMALLYPRQWLKAYVALRTWLVLSWFYFRALDLAGLGF